MRAAVAAFVVLASLAAAPAQAAVTASPRGVRFPAVAVNEQGRVVVAWERSRGGRFFVEARTGAGLRSLGPIRRLGGRVGYQPQVAIGEDGTAAVTWVGPGPGNVRRLQAALARPGRPFGAVQTVDARTSILSAVGVAVQPTGRVVAVYHRSTDSIGFALAARGRPFGRPRSLASTGSVSAASVTLDPRDGAVLVAYGTPPRPPARAGDRGSNTQAAVVSLGTGNARFGPPTLVSAP
jgi:opacity protein-like surface antigen